MERFRRFGEASKLVAPRGVTWIQHLFPSLFAERRLRALAVLLADQIIGFDLAMVSGSGLYALEWRILAGSKAL
jgi:hypothetical protein